MDYLLVIHLLIPCNYCVIQSRLKTVLCSLFKCMLRERLLCDYNMKPGGTCFYINTKTLF